MSLDQPSANEMTIAAATRMRAICAACGALALSATVVATAIDNHTPLGAPRFWPWLLTGLQVLALWSAGTGRWWGWLLGGSVQLPWIAYAIVTAQFGFIPGCMASSLIQLFSFSRDASRQAGSRWPSGVRAPWKGGQS